MLPGAKGLTPHAPAHRRLKGPGLRLCIKLHTIENIINFSHEKASKEPQGFIICHLRFFIYAFYLIMI